MISLGLRLRWLGTDRLTWRDLLVIAAQTSPGDELYHALYPDEPRPVQIWAHMAEFMRSVEYSERWMQWTKTTDGQRNRNIPEPFSFPWEAKPKNKYSGQRMTWDEATEFLGWQKKRGGA